MLKRLWKRLDDFEDTAVAPVIGVMILALVTFAILLVPATGIGGVQ